MKLLSHLKIRTKLTSMVCLAALTITAIIAVSAFLSKSRMMEDRVQQMKTAVDILYTLAQSVQDDVTAGKLTQAEAKAQFHMRGRRMTFNGNQGYPVVYNADTSILVNGANQQLEGKITGAKDSNGVLIADAIISAGNQTAQGGVTSYLYPRPGQTEPVRKTVFNAQVCALERDDQLRPLCRRHRRRRPRADARACRDRRWPDAADGDPVLADRPRRAERARPPEDPHAGDF
ncbi:signal transduction histidine kinase [Bradyrhizobium sp. LM4.3]